MNVYKTKKGLENVSRSEAVKVYSCSDGLELSQMADVNGRKMRGEVPRLYVVL